MSDQAVAVEKCEPSFCGFIGIVLTEDVAVEVEPLTAQVLSALL